MNQTARGAGIELFDLALRQLSPPVFVAVNRRVAASPFPITITNSRRDLCQPSGELSFAAKFGQAEVGVNEDGLHQLFDHRRIAGEQPHSPCNVALVPRHDPRVRLPITL